MLERFVLLLEQLLTIWGCTRCHHWRFVCSPYLAYLEVLAICVVQLEFDFADLFSGDLEAKLLVLCGKLYLQYHCNLIASMAGFPYYVIENKNRSCK